MLRNLTVQVIIAAVLGILIALYLTLPAGLHDFILLLKDAFIRALRMLIAPMIFFSLIGGVIGIGNVVRLKSLGGMTVLYYLGTTSIAIALALLAVFFVHPWTNYPAAMEIAGNIATEGLIDPGEDSVAKVLGQIASQALSNPFSALVNLNILGIVTNALLIGIAMVLVLPGDSPMFSLVRQLNQVIAKILSWIILTLPVGIFAILYDFTLKMGASQGQAGEFLVQLFSFGVLVIVLTLIHGVLVLPGIAYLFTKRTPANLLRNIARPLIVAFSTSSSSATLPVTMKTCEEQLKVSNSVSSFVLPLGATMNMDGTALFEAVGAVFLAYLYGIDLSNTAIVTVFIMAMLASIGAPGMPSASMAGMQMVLLAVGIPLEGIAILMVIERPLDTIRTACNVEGDLVGSLIVEKYFRRRESGIPAQAEDP